jgi:hypothetical protein
MRCQAKKEPDGQRLTGPAVAALLILALIVSIQWLGIRALFASAGSLVPLAYYPSDVLA